MKKEIQIEIVTDDKEKIQKLMARAIADITKRRIEELPEHLRVEAYETLIEKVKEVQK